MKPVIISIVIVVNITLNFIVIAVIAKYPQLREDRTTLFMFSLTLSDLAAGCTCMPISAALCSNATPSVRNMLRYLPKIQAVGLTWFSFNSLHSLCWMTVCKMVAILKPFRYEQLLTRNRCYFIIACIWLTGALIAVTGTHFTMTWNLAICMCQMPLNSKLSVAYAVVCVVLCVVFPVITIVYTTARILSVIIRVHLQTTAQVHSIGGDSVVTGNSASVTLQTIRSGRNVLLMCMGVVVITFPITTAIVLRAVGLENKLPSWYGFVAFWIGLCNASFNCVLYLVLFRSVRTKTKQMLKECCQLRCLP